jgi:hypothetical protein
MQQLSCHPRVLAANEVAAAQHIPGPRRNVAHVANWRRYDVEPWGKPFTATGGKFYGLWKYAHWRVFAAVKEQPPSHFSGLAHGSWLSSGLHSEQPQANSEDSSKPHSAISLKKRHITGRF